MERDRNRTEMAKKNMKQTDFTGGRNKEIHKMKKEKKNHEKEKTQQKEIKEE